MNINETIANWILQARKQARLSQLDLGVKLALELGNHRGNSKQNISHWENQRHNPNTEQLIAISKITGVQLPSSLTQNPGHKVEQSRAKYGNSLDMPLLREAITVSIQEARNANIDLSPEHLSTLIAYLYDKWSEEGKHQLTTGELKRILRLVA